MSTVAASVKRISSKRDERVFVHSHCPDRPYVELEIPADFHTAHHVEFTTKSRDQGWCDKDNALAYKTSLGVNWKPWLESLTPGDVIELIPRAAYPGWLNIVREARIDLEYESLSEESQTAGTYLPFERNVHLYPRPLDKESLEIRVLAIHPGSSDDPITCAFNYVRLIGEESDHLSFEALSYTWGYPKELATVGFQSDGAECGGVQQLSVTPSAEAAIRRLRDRSRVLYLWIDAVCINQLDNEERAWQVRIMATTFSKARIVHVWLGEHQGIEAALRIIRDVHNYNHRVCNGGGDCECRGTSHSSAKDIAELVESDSRELEYHKGIRTIFKHHSKSFNHQAREYAGGTINPHVFRLMSHLFGHPWFRRSWVIREVLMSMSPVVHCGAEATTWKELVDLNSWLADPRLIGSEPHLYYAFVTMPVIWSDLRPERHTRLSTSNDQTESEMSSQKPSILDVYLATLDLKCSEARDKLFSILSFGRETSGIEALPEALQPDYTKTEQQVFADFTKWWIKRYQSLSILSSVHGERRRTWVRVVSDTKKVFPPQRPTWIVPRDGSPRWCQATLGHHWNFRAAGNTIPDVRLLDDTPFKETHKYPRLRVMGHRIADISRLTYLFTEHQHHTENEQQREIFDVYNSIIDPSNLNDYWKVRLSNIKEDYTSKAQARLQDHLVAHWNYFRRQKLDAVDPMCKDEKYKQTTALPTCMDAFAFTTTNDMLGLCPWFAREGDNVVLLHGGNVPYLLRAVDTNSGEKRNGGTDDSSFEFVGECFVQGIMHGELMGALIEKDVKPEVFTLI